MHVYKYKLDLDIVYDLCIVYITYGVTCWTLLMFSQLHLKGTNNKWTQCLCGCGCVFVWSVFDRISICRARFSKMLRYSECHFGCRSFIRFFSHVTPLQWLIMCAVFDYVYECIRSDRCRFNVGSSTFSTVVAVRWRWRRRWTNKDSSDYDDVTTTIASSDAYVCDVYAFYCRRPVVICMHVRAYLYIRVYTRVSVSLCVRMCMLSPNRCVYGHRICGSDRCMYTHDVYTKDQEPFFAGQWMTVQLLLLTMDFELLTF